MIIMMTTTQDRYNSEESLEEENQSTTSSTESRQSDFAKKDDGFIPTRRSDHQMSMKYKSSNTNKMHIEIPSSVQTHPTTRPALGSWPASLQAMLDSSQGIDKTDWIVKRPIGPSSTFQDAVIFPVLGICLLMDLDLSTERWWQNCNPDIIFDVDDCDDYSSHYNDESKVSLSRPMLQFFVSFVPGGVTNI